MTAAAALPLRTPEGFRAFRHIHGLSQRKLADLLGMKWDGTISRYENGQLPIPKVVEMALLWLDHQGIAAPTPGPIAELREALCAESPDDEVNVRAYFEDISNATDVLLAASGDKRALIRLRKDCGLPAFR